jgi:hypothetical protein
VVVPYVHDPSPLVRQAAVNALQAIPGRTGIPALASQLAREASPFVQTAILQTLTTKKQPIPAVQQWLKTHVPQAKHASLRLAMINHLGTFMATYPTNKQLLISMMRTESNPTRIRLIAKYIHQK